MQIHLSNKLLAHVHHDLRLVGEENPSNTHMPEVRTIQTGDFGDCEISIVEER